MPPTGPIWRHRPGAVCCCSAPRSIRSRLPWITIHDGLSPQAVLRIADDGDVQQAVDSAAIMECRRPPALAVIHLGVLGLDRGTMSRFALFDRTAPRTTTVAGDC